MADIKYDMYGKIKSAKEVAAKALGKVDVGSKVLKTPAPAKAKLDVETKTTENSAVSEASNCCAPEVKGKILAKLKMKKAVAKTEEPTTKSQLTEEDKTVKNIPQDATKARKAKEILKAKRANAKETKLK